MKRTGLLGGSFDPVHNAHIALAQAAHQILQLDEVQLIPAANPWQRRPLAAAAGQRLAMLDLAIGGRPHLCVNPLELERGGKTYTIETLQELPENADYHWILGADQLDNFCSWHRWEDIAARVKLVIAQRPGTPLAVPLPLQQRLTVLGHALIELPFEPMAISATLIRQRAAAGLPLCGLVDVAVGQYIKHNKLYQSPAA